MEKWEVEAGTTVIRSLSYCFVFLFHFCSLEERLWAVLIDFPSSSLVLLKRNNNFEERCGYYSLYVDVPSYALFAARNYQHCLSDLKNDHKRWISQTQGRTRTRNPSFRSNWPSQPANQVHHWWSLDLSSRCSPRGCRGESLLWNFSHNLCQSVGQRNFGFLLVDRWWGMQPWWSIDPTDQTLSCWKELAHLFQLCWQWPVHWSV